MIFFLIIIYLSSLICGAKIIIILNLTDTMNLQQQFPLIYGTL